MKLIGLIKSKTREKILRFFFSHKDKKYYLRELERRLKLPVGNIRRELLSLEKISLFKREKVGNLVYYSLNEKSPFLGVIENIISPSSKRKKSFKRSKMTEKDLIVLKKRDIDLLRQKIDELNNIFETISEKKSEIEDFLNLGVVVNKKGEVLLVKRANPEKGRGRAVLTWAFPGGKQHINESREECVIREVLAETGYKIKPIKEISSRFHPQFPVFIVYHLCKLVSPNPIQKPKEPHEISEIKWVKSKEVKELFGSNLDPGVARELGLK